MTTDKNISVTHTGSSTWTLDDIRGGYVIKKHTDQAAFCVRPPARIPVPDMRPTRGYIQHLSRIPDGERWPVLSFRVVGVHDDHERRFAAMLTNEGRWRWFDGHTVACPDECHLSQGQLGDVLAAAGIAPGLPFQSQDTMNLTTIEYVERVTRPAVAMAEEWKPRAPTWRGGKPWR